MTDDKDDTILDLSPLDPQRDPAHWEALVQSITRRAVANRVEANREAPGLFFGLFQLTRPALALALGLAVVVWTGALVSRPGASVAQPQDPTLSLLSWANAETMPEPSDMLATFGGSHDTGR
jgi:hypothetical protein